jgi:hypothetical protein
MGNPVNGQATPVNLANRGLATSRERQQYNVSTGIRAPETRAAQKFAVAVATGPINTAIIGKRAVVMSCRTRPKNSPVVSARRRRSAPSVRHNKGKYQARDRRIAGALRHH